MVEMDSVFWYRIHIDLQPVLVGCRFARNAAVLPKACPHGCAVSACIVFQLPHTLWRTPAVHATSEVLTACEPSEFTPHVVCS